jgi:hypothetical protein
MSMPTAPARRDRGRLIEAGAGGRGDPYAAREPSGLCPSRGQGGALGGGG